MIKKRILIITKNFLPYFQSIGGILRVLKLAEFLNNNEYHVTIMAAKGTKLGYFGYEELIKKLDIRYISDYFQKRDNLLNFKRSIETISQNSHYRTLRTILHDFVIPDKGVVLIWKYVNASINLIREENIDTVIISSPPFSMQIIGPIIKMIFKENVKLIADYRDGWNISKINSKRYSISKKLNFVMEKIILHYSDFITCVSNNMQNEMSILFPNYFHKIEVIMNGYDEEMLNTSPMNRNIINSNNNEEFLTIGYFGSISDSHDSYRDPTLLLEEIRNNKKISISFFGNINIQKAWLDKIGHRLRISGSLSHRDAIDFMSQYDILLVIHTEIFGGAEVLTGKLFDYLMTFKPILVIGPQNMEAGSFVVRNGFGYFANCNNRVEIRQTLDRIYSDWISNRLPHYTLEDIKCYSRQYQYKKFIDLIER